MYEEDGDLQTLSNSTKGGVAFMLGVLDKSVRMKAAAVSRWLNRASPTQDCAYIRYTSQSVVTQSSTIP